jgi:hypothetical protein
VLNNKVGKQLKQLIDSELLKEDRQVLKLMCIGSIPPYILIQAQGIFKNLSILKNANNILHRVAIQVLKDPLKIIPNIHVVLGFQSLVLLRQDKGLLRTEF